jgi:hypothetical protein
MEDNAKTAKCRYCQQTIFWFKSRQGKFYCCNSDNKRDFHDCAEREQDSHSHPDGQQSEQSNNIADAELRSMMLLVVSVGYRRLSQKFHPDRGGRSSDMQSLNEAVARLRRVTA